VEGGGVLADASAPIQLTSRTADLSQWLVNRFLIIDIGDRGPRSSVARLSVILGYPLSESELSVIGPAVAGSGTVHCCTAARRLMRLTARATISDSGALPASHGCRRIVALVVCALCCFK
jgi:hypothetical protein